MKKHKLFSPTIYYSVIKAPSTYTFPLIFFNHNLAALKWGSQSQKLKVDIKSGSRNSPFTPREKILFIGKLANVYFLVLEKGRYSGAPDFA